MIKKVIFRFCIIGLIIAHWACENDNEIVEPQGKPKIVLAINNLQEKAIKPGEIFISLVSLKRGGAKMRGVTVLEDDRLVAVDRLKINNLLALGNPIFLYPPDDEEGSLRIEIKSPNKTGSFNYKFIVTDYKGDTSVVSRKINIGSQSPTLKYNGPDLAITTFLKEAKFKINGIKGTGRMFTLSVLEDNVLVTPSRMKFGTSKPSANPFALDLADQSVFDKDLFIISGSQPKTIYYTFIVSDEFGATARDSARVLIGTPTTELTNKELYNYARGGNAGALSLETGNSSDSTNINADIIDMGIDSNVTEASNWRRQIRAAKGVEVKRIFNGINGVLQSFSYASVFTQEQIADLFPKGVNLPLVDDFGRPISETLQLGQIFVAKRGSKYYLFEVAGLIPTTNDNQDIVRFNIKK
jgi:hypothetical protein